MEDFTKEIKEHNLRKALEIEAMGNQENEDFTEAIDEVADTLNKSLEDGLIGREEYERDFDNLDQIIQKARPHKYIKCEGTTGNYKYYYTLEEYKAAQGGAVDTTEGEDKKVEIDKKFVSEVQEWIGDEFPEEFIAGIDSQLRKKLGENYTKVNIPADTSYDENVEIVDKKIDELVGKLNFLEISNDLNEDDVEEILRGILNVQFNKRSK